MRRQLGISRSQANAVMVFSPHGPRSMKGILAQALARGGSGRTVWLYSRDPGGGRDDAHLTIDQPAPGHGQEPGSSSATAFYAAVQAPGRHRPAAHRSLRLIQKLPWVAAYTLSRNCTRRGPMSWISFWRVMSKMGPEQLNARMRLPSRDTMGTPTA